MRNSRNMVVATAFAAALAATPAASQDFSTLAFVDQISSSAKALTNVIQYPAVQGSSNLPLLPSIPSAPGAGNLANVLQQGFQNSAYITQSGQGNVGLIQQIGEFNSASITQTGTGHRGVVFQSGRNNTAVIVQR